MGAKTSKYFEVLKSESVQSAFRSGNVPVAFLAQCIETGIVDCKDEALLFEIEQSFGRRLHPKNPPTVNMGAQSPNTRPVSTAGMPVVGGVKLPLEKTSLLPPCTPRP